MALLAQFQLHKISVLFFHFDLSCDHKCDQTQPDVQLLLSVLFVAVSQKVVQQGSIDLASELVEFSLHHLNFIRRVCRSLFEVLVA